LIRRNPTLQKKPWFRWMAGSLPLPLKDIAFHNLTFAVLGFVLVFDIGTYSYYRGSVVTPFHGGPVSPTKHHLTLSDARLLPDGSVRFHVYLDAGTPEAPVHVRRSRSARCQQPATRALRRRRALRVAKDRLHERLRLQQIRARFLSGSELRWELPPP